MNTLSRTVCVVLLIFVTIPAISSSETNQLTRLVEDKVNYLSSIVIGFKQDIKNTQNPELKAAKINLFLANVIMLGAEIELVKIQRKVEQEKQSKMSKNSNTGMLESSYGHRKFNITMLKFKDWQRGVDEFTEQTMIINKRSSKDSAFI